MFYNNKDLRHELKYYINNTQYFELKNKLKILMKLDNNSIDGKAYNIQSLYFDDLYDSSLYEKNYGIFKRKKIRIRAYNFRDDFIRLEIKGKYGNYIYKDSSKLTREEYNSILNNNTTFLLTSKDPVKSFMYSEISCSYLRPKVIVDYYREAYVHSIGNVRITFDKGLRSVTNTMDLFSQNQVMLSAIDKNLIILEVKYTNFLPTHLRNLLNLYTSEYCAISKYVLCREKINQTNKI